MGLATSDCVQVALCDVVLMIVWGKVVCKEQADLGIDAQ
jgi:hypothetical protein